MTLLDRGYAQYYWKRNESAVALLSKKRLKRSGTIMVVCKGNVCRSAFLAEYLKTIADPICGFTFTSSGIRTSDGSVSPETALRCAAEYGIDLSSHRGSRITNEEIEKADLIIGMEPIHHVEFLLRYFKWRKKFLLLRALENRTPSLIVPDPFEKSPETFRDCFALLARDGRLLLSALQAVTREGIQ